jgi:hypothetical protein
MIFFGTTVAQYAVTARIILARQEGSSTNINKISWLNAISVGIAQTLET